MYLENLFTLRKKWKNFIHQLLALDRLILNKNIGKWSPNICKLISTKAD